MEAGRNTEQLVENKMEETGGEHSDVSSETEMTNNVPIYRDFVTINCCKIIRPPENWLGPLPTIASELYVSNLPGMMTEQELLQLCVRFGFVYEMRVPISRAGGHRGSAYIKYQHPSEADCAVYVLSHFFLPNRSLLKINISHDKCRLFMTNVPRRLSEAEIEKGVRKIYPNILRVYTHAYRYCSNSSATRYTDGDGDRHEWRNNGYAFLHFCTHTEALRAKRSAVNGFVSLWGRDVSIDWGYVNREKYPQFVVNNCIVENCSIFIRQIDPDVFNNELFHAISAVVPREAIVGLRRIYTMALVDFSTRGAAEKVIMHLQGMPMHTKRLHLQWAKQKMYRVLHALLKLDFSVHLRLKCIANYWAVPVIIIGTYHAVVSKQCVAVMLRNAEGVVRYVISVVDVRHINDIHSRACEVVNRLLESCGGFPEFNNVFHVYQDIAHFVGSIVLIGPNIIFTPVAKPPTEPQTHCLDEVALMCWAAEVLAPHYSANEIWLTYLPHFHLGGQYKFGALFHNYRRKPFLKHNLNSEEIVLILCSVSTGTNLPHYSFSTAAKAANINLLIQGGDMPQYFYLMLQPWYSFNHVVYGQTQYSINNVVQLNCYNQVQQFVEEGYSEPAMQLLPIQVCQLVAPQGRTAPIAEKPTVG